MKYETRKSLRQRLGAMESRTLGLYLDSLTDAELQQIVDEGDEELIARGVPREELEAYNQRVQAWMDSLSDAELKEVAHGKRWVPFPAPVAPDFSD
jgi:hypothetical protein